MKRIIITLLSIHFVLLAFAQEKPKELILEEILVTEKQEKGIKKSIHTHKTMVGKARNIGEILSSQPGFGIIKRGGYAMEPVLRSFRYDQINTQYDGGMQMASACANRMDPLTSRVSAEEIQKIEVIKGPYSVRFGQSLGGILNIITERPDRVDSFKLSGSAEGGFETNGNSKYGRVSLLAANKGYDFYVNGGIKDYGNYTSGNEQEIASEYIAYDYVAKLGINPSENQRIQFNWRQSFADKVLHAGLPMDAKDDKSYVASADYYAKNLGSFVYSFKAKAYHAFVDHWMTNEWRPVSKKVDAITGVTSEVTGGRMEFTLLPADKTTIFVGADLKLVNKQGERYRTVKINPCTNMEMSPAKKFTDKVWQNSNNNNYGVFAESVYLASEKLKITSGFRLDYMQSTVDDLASDFSEEYGTDTDVNDELNFSLTATADYEIGNGYSLQLSAGRGTRAPSLLERYINHLTVGQDAHEYVGNPNLKSEVNYQTDFSVTKAGKQYSVYVNVFYSYLENYITSRVDENLPRKYMPCMEPKFAKRFENADEAFQAGFEFGSSLNLHKYISINGSLAYTYAHNKSWDEPMAEVPPLSANVSLTFENKQLTAQVKSRFVANQDRIAVSFGEGETPAYELFDFQFEYRLWRQLALRAGVNNILNRNYYDHLSRPYKNMPEQSMFYEPGRNFTFGAQVRF